MEFATLENNRFMLDGSYSQNIDFSERHNGNHAIFSACIDSAATANDIISSISYLRDCYCDCWGEYPEVIRINNDMYDKLSVFCTENVINKESNPSYSQVFGMRIEIGESAHIMMCRDIDYTKRA